MFFPDDAVRVAALSEYVDRWVSDRLLQRPPEETMTAATTVSPTLREPQLLGQTVVVISAALPAFTKALAPVRVNLIAAGFVDTPLSASLLGDNLETLDDRPKGLAILERIRTSS